MRTAVQPRRGAALLIVLVVLLVLTTAATISVEAAGNARLSASFRNHHQTVPSAIRAADSAAREWLSAKSSEFVLPADAQTPMAEVLTAELTFGDIACMITLRAWDERGMVGPTHMASNPRILSVVPRPVSRAAQAIRLDDVDRPGLDLFCNDDGTSAAIKNGVQVFPGARDGMYAIGEWITLADRHSALNVNTAPMPLIEAVGDSIGIDQLELIRTARERGERPSLAGIRGSKKRGALQLTSGSDRWAFRFDIDAHGFRSSYWCVYENSGMNWRCIQRVAITD